VDPAHVLWIGGPQGTERSSVARALAGRFRLQLYVIDDHEQEHAARMPTTDSSSRDWFVTESRHRFRLVLEDLRGLPAESAVIVEGPQLLPTFVAAVLRDPDQALFLLPDPADDLPARTIEREAREVRLPVLRVDAPLEAMVERAAAQLDPVVARLSAATGTSR
jgi:hypothetical protein